MERARNGQRLARRVRPLEQPHPEMLGLLGELERNTANALERVIKEEKARVRSGLGPYAAPSEAEALMVRGDGDNLEPTVRSITAFPSHPSILFLSPLPVFSSISFHTP